MNEQDVHIDARIAALEDTFPARSDAWLALSLLRALAEGRPVSTEALARRSDVPEEVVAERLATWPTIARDDDRIVAFTGLRLRRTAHTFCLGERRLFTWCAWDALSLPELLERTAHVQSTCPATGRRISVTVTPQAVLDVTPRGGRLPGQPAERPRHSHDVLPPRQLPRLRGRRPHMRGQPSWQRAADRRPGPSARPPRERAVLAQDHQATPGATP